MRLERRSVRGGEPHRQTPFMTVRFGTIQISVPIEMPLLVADHRHGVHAHTAELVLGRSWDGAAVLLPLQRMTLGTGLSIKRGY
jgi:hypothetical protein